MSTARYREISIESHLEASKRIIKYLKGTTMRGILYMRNTRSNLLGWYSFDYAGDVDDRKNTSGYVFMLHSGSVSWFSMKQPIVTFSTTKVVFVETTSCAYQDVWLISILEQLLESQKECKVILCDNSSSIKLSKYSMMHMGDAST